MERKSLYMQIYNDLLEDIKNNKYPPGSCLPSELSISKTYGVSRITSKKAMEMLAEQELIVRKPGKGSYVLGQGYEHKEVQRQASSDTTDNKMIGVLMDSFGDTFGGEILFGMERQCEQLGYDMILKCSHGNREEETRAIKRFIDIGVLGIVIMCVHDDNYNNEILRLSLRKFPLVLIDRKLKGVPLAYVGTDNYKASKELTEHLFNNGHRYISYVAPKSIETSTVTDRFRGFIDSHMEHGVITNESYWITDLMSTLPSFHKENLVQKDIQKLKKFITEHPEITGFFAVEYGIAKIIYSALRELGIANEKAIACFDGVSNSNMTSQFSYVQQGQYQIGTKCIEVLSECISGNEVLETTLIPYNIVVDNK